MTDNINTTPEAVSQHLDISHNHEAGLIPMSTQTMMRAMSDRIEQLEAKLAKAMAGLEESQREIDQYIQFEYPSDHPVHEGYRKRDFSANPARLALAEIKGSGQ